MPSEFNRAWGDFGHDSDNIFSTAEEDIWPSQLHQNEDAEIINGTTVLRE
jgi:hypothetical protein